MVQHGAHPPGGGDVRGDHQRLVPALRFLFFIGLWVSVASAQPVTRIVVPFAAGGVQDIVARSINAELGTALGRSVIVENRAGAGGTIGAAYVAKSAPDGQTLILAGASHTIAGSLYTKLPYHPLQDFTPLAPIDESGVPTYAFDSWIGILGPAGIPRGTVDAINAAMERLLRDPVILERLDKQGVVPQALRPEAFGELLRADFAKMARVVKISGARID